MKKYLGTIFLIFGFLPYPTQTLVRTRSIHTVIFMGNWRDRFEKSINQKTGRKLSVYFELYEGAWISADSSGIWRVDRGEINIICFFQNQAVGAKRIYPKDSGIAKSNRDFIVRCRHEQSICRCSGRVSERRTAGSHIFYMGGWKKVQH